MGSWSKIRDSQYTHTSSTSGVSIVVDIRVLKTLSVKTLLDLFCSIVFPPQGLIPVNANVNVTMATADEQIRVSDTVKRELDRRRREGESYNDVLQRMLEDDRDLMAGFGRWSDEQANRARKAREKSKQKSKDRMRRLADDE